MLGQSAYPASQITDRSLDPSRYVQGPHTLPPLLSTSQQRELTGFQENSTTTNTVEQNQHFGAGAADIAKEGSGEPANLLLSLLESSGKIYDIQELPLKAASPASFAYRAIKTIATTGRFGPAVAGAVWIRHILVQCIRETRRELVEEFPAPRSIYDWIEMWLRSIVRAARLIGLCYVETWSRGAPRILAILQGHLAKATKEVAPHKPVIYVPSCARFARDDDHKTGSRSASSAYKDHRPRGNFITVILVEVSIGCVVLGLVVSLIAYLSHGFEARQSSTTQKVIMLLWLCEGMFGSLLPLVSLKELLVV